MEQNIIETYTNEGKSFLELIQEWVDENNNYLYCKIMSKDIKYSHR